MYKSICKLKTSGKMENKAFCDSKNVKLTQYQKQNTKFWPYYFGIQSYIIWERLFPYEHVWAVAVLRIWVNMRKVKMAAKESKYLSTTLPEAHYFPNNIYIFIFDHNEPHHS